MNRLTDRSKELPLPCAGNASFWARVHEKLARYEDTGLEPEEAESCKVALIGKSLAEIKEIEGIPVERMKALAKAEAEGRLLVLPCKVGDELWFEKNGKIQCETIDRITVNQTDEDDDLFISIYTMSVSVLAEDIGRLVFLSREDAEKALEGDEQ